MDITLSDWIAGLVVLLVAMPLLVILRQYGRVHLGHPWRLARVLRRLGLNLESLAEPQRNVATYLCNTCPHTERCEQWLEKKSNPDAYKSFCPNAGLIDGLLPHPK
jgi:hypothetical protein